MERSARFSVDVCQRRTPPLLREVDEGLMVGLPARGLWLVWQWLALRGLQLREL